MELLILAAVLIAVVLVGLAYQAAGSALDNRRYPSPGRLVDVGGHRLHLQESGEGTPMVVMDSGLPGSSLSWRFVQPEVAKFTGTVSYDRAGLGWSDGGPEPRTSRQIVEELRTLLKRVGANAPYVLVGHSFGGFTARLYAATYPAEVAGVVLVDSIHPAEFELTDEQRTNLMKGARLCRRAAWAARLGVARLISFLAHAGLWKAARFGVSTVTGGAIRGEGRMFSPWDRLPEDLKTIVRTFWLRPKFFDALASQVESLPESARQVATTGDLGNLPLIVLTAGNSTPARAEAQEDLAKLSARGRQVVVPESGHWIQLDQPERVVDAIRAVVEEARRAERKS